MNILICWEDKYFEGMHRALSRVRKARVGTNQKTPPNVERRSVRGYGGFQRYVNQDWGTGYQHGLLRPPSNGPIDALICVADADCAGECCPGLQAPSSPSDDWIAAANQSWTTHLRTFATQAPQRVFGHFLRWNRESVVIACFDQPQVMEELGTRAYQQSTINTFLEKCSPDPRQIEDQVFVDTYLDPTQCLESLMHALGHKSLKKNSVSVEDSLKAFPHAPSAQLLERVPDLTSLASLVNSLDTPANRSLLAGFSQESINTLLEAVATHPNKRTTSLSQVQAQLERDYALFGQLALQEELSSTNREAAAMIFAALHNADTRPIQVSEQTIFSQLEEVPELQEALLVGSDIQL